MPIEELDKCSDDIIRMQQEIGCIGSETNVWALSGTNRLEGVYLSL